MHSGFETDSRHTDWLLYAFLTIDDKLLRQNVQDLLVRRNRHRARRIDHAIHVALSDFLFLDGDDAVRIHAADMAARDSRIDRLNPAACHQLGFLDGALNRLHRGLQIDHHPFFQATGRMGSDAHHLDFTVFVCLADDAGDLGGADVQTDDEISI